MGTVIVVKVLVQTVATIPIVVDNMRDWVDEDNDVDRGLAVQHAQLVVDDLVNEVNTDFVQTGIIELTETEVKGVVSIGIQRLLEPA